MYLLPSPPPEVTVLTINPFAWYLLISDVKDEDIPYQSVNTSFGLAGVVIMLLDTTDADTHVKASIAINIEFFISSLV
jgi:hypothetical protein